MNNRQVDPDQKIRFKIKVKKSLHMKSNIEQIAYIIINSNKFKEEIKNNLLLVAIMKVNPKYLLIHNKNS
jgi:hypothetical protein